MHLIIDGYGGDYKKMQDVEFISEILDVYPEQIGMTKISDPQVSKYIGTKPEDWGVSGFVLIAEPYKHSHLPRKILYQYRYLLMQGIRR